jgi:glycosyltransferase involved in cell wall biosynthesis
MHATSALPSSADSPPGAAPALLVVVKGYPRVSETFIAQEIAALERRGLPLIIASLRRPTDRVTHPVHRAIKAAVLYLPEYLYHAPFRVAAAHLALLRRAPRRYGASLRLWLGDLRRDPTPNRGRRFGQAGVLAAELPAGIRHLHVHFLHTPASVARYAALMTGVGYSLSGHAKDIWTSPDWEIAEKLAGARFVVTCTAANREQLLRLCPEAPAHLVYHGLDRRLFAPPPVVGSRRDGSDPADPVRLLSVGRLHPKKGFDILLRALARLRRHAVLTLVGYGAEERRLRELAEALGLGDRVRWAGQLDQRAVLARYRESDLFVLASRIAGDGDRDGLPNVVVEALSQGLPVVASRVSALPEIVEDGLHGRLVPPEDPAALAAALDALIRDPALRQEMGAAGLRRVAEGWDVETGADRLAALLRQALGEAAAELPAPASRGGP